MPNTALKLDHGRQRVLNADITIGFANLVDNAIAVKAIDLPYGARIISGELDVDTAFNAGTSMVIAVGDPTVPNRYLASGNMAATGRTPLVPTGYVSTDGAAVQVTPTIVGAVPTAGSARLSIQYVIAGRADEVQPS